LKIYVQDIVWHIPMRVSCDAKVVQVPDCAHDSKLLSAIQELFSMFYCVVASTRREDLLVRPGSNGLATCEEGEGRHTLQTVMS